MSYIYDYIEFDVPQADPDEKTRGEILPLVPGQLESKENVIP